ncbi:MAG: carboxypeptidase regulatory-like domain-containing protein [Candidatus Wildermuthbacteria bacterium]|nr:carboxypeptidase regulatory-like domain-containing protein [Candidatus Wildermuthbacteria bacterium]
MRIKYTHNNGGFSLVEILVGVSLLLVVFSGIFGVYQLGLQVMSQSEARLTATALANQKIEAIRNAAYQDVGTVGGVPPGIMAQEETVLQNGVRYTIETTIVYIDDPHDLMAPADPLPTDYKRAKVEAFWQGRFNGSVMLMSDVAPKGIETSVGGGTLSLNVFNAEGVGVSQASVRIVNEGVIPAIDATYQTDTYGAFVLPGAPAFVEGYRISASKQGYSQERTYGADELETPAKPHASVYEGQTTEVSFSIDEISTMAIESRGKSGQGYPVAGNIPFTMTGSKLIGEHGGEPVYKYSETSMTDNSGNLTLFGMEWDSYSFSVNKQQTGLDLIDVEVPPGTSVAQPVALLPNAVLNVRLVVKAEHSLLATVKDEASSQPIFGAAARLFNAAEYDEVRPTDEIGQAFFVPLESGSYTLEVSMPGYQTETAAVSVSGAMLQTIFLETQ